MFNSYSYAEINKPLNYKKNIENDTPSFSKYQDNLKQDVYCGGKSSYAIGGLQMKNTTLSVTYFSDKNMAKIQSMIKSYVYRETKGKFKLDANQDESDLLVVMRFIFLEYGLNLPTHISQQVEELNKKTVNYIVPDLITNVKQHYDYLRDISQPIKPIERPMNVGSKGRKTLPSVTTTWGF